MSRLLMAATGRLFRVSGGRYSHISPNIYLVAERAEQLINRSNLRKFASQATEKEKKPPKPGYFPSGGTHAVLNDLPMPEGDFMKAWHAKNSKYNMVLISGLVALIGSIALAIQSGVMPLYFFPPDYPYTQEELIDFDREKEIEREEQEAREERHWDLVDARELSIRRREAKDDMARERILMQKDIDEGLSDAELLELQKLAENRAEFDKWEDAELKRLKEVAKSKEFAKKQKEKEEKERQREKAQRQKDREREAKQLEKVEMEKEKERKAKEKAAAKN